MTLITMVSPIRSQYLKVSILISLCLTLHTTSADTKPPSEPDPKRLIGHQIVDRKYPDGWKETEDSTHGSTHNFVVLKNKAVFVYVLERVNGKKAQVMDVITIKGRPSKKNVWYQIGDQCKKNGQKIPPYEDGKLFEAETVFKKCQRYSKNVLSAWVVDLRTHKFTKYPTEGLRCANDYLDSGEMSQCTFIPSEE